MPIDKTKFLSCKTRADLARLLDIKVSVLTYFAYGNGKRYKKFSIAKKGGGQREILAPVDGLKSIQRKLASYLDAVYPAPAYVFGFINGRSIVSNAERHMGKRVILNFDLKDFFPSITSPRLIGLLKAAPFNFSNEIASAVVSLVTYQDRLPQGAPTSPVLSNMICFRLDRALCDLAKRDHLGYTRYADDITFSTRKSRFPASVVKNGSKGLELGDEIIKVISANHFQINDSKTRIHFGKKAKYVTGVKVNLIPNLPRTWVRQIRAMLHAWKKHGLASAQSEYSVKYTGGNKDFAQVVRGKIAHLKNIKGEADLTYRRLYNKLVAVDGGGRPTLPESEIEELYDKVFVVESGGKKGTAFILDQKYLLTCNHVLADDAVEYFTYNEFPSAARKRTNVNRAYTSAEFDVAALSPQASDKVARRSFMSAPALEDVVVRGNYRVMGFPNYILGARPQIMDVTVTKLERDKYGILNAYVDKKMISGNSGGPVFNNKNQIVGMVLRGTGGLATGDDTTGYIFLPIVEIRRFLAGLELSL